MAKSKPKTKPIEKESFLPDSEFFGTAVIGTKGQFVIPKEARDAYKMNPGDKIIIFGGKGGVLAIIKAEKLNDLLSTLPIK